MKGSVKLFFGITLCVVLFVCLFPLTAKETDQKTTTAAVSTTVSDVWPDSLALVGAGIPGINEWDPADPAGDMTQVSDNVYEKTVEFLSDSYIEFKIIGNDTMDDVWCLGEAEIVPGTASILTNGSAAQNMKLTVEEACTLRFTVDLNGLCSGGSATLLVENVKEPESYRTLTVIPPDFWTEVYAFTWKPEIFGVFPGLVIEKVENVYQTTIKESIVDLILCGQMGPDKARYQTSDITLETNGEDVTVYVADDCTYRVVYGDFTVGDQYRVVGSEDWMGYWDVTSDAGLMEQIDPGIYLKCFKNVAPGRYQFKITKNGTWDECWGDNGADYCIEIASICDVVVTFTLPDQIRVSAIISDDEAEYGELNMDEGDVDDTLPENQEMSDSKSTTDKVPGIVEPDNSSEIVPETDPAKILELAYGLELNQSMPYDVTLAGRVSKVEEAYSSEYKNITVMFCINGCEDKPVLLHRLTGEGVERIALGNTVTVTGRLKNDEGIVKMSKGVMVRLHNYTRPPASPAEFAGILADAAKLNDGEELAYDVTLNGRVLSIDEVYHAEYQNVSVTISVNDSANTLKLYRLKGHKADQLEVGDKIVVVGRIRKYCGELELINGVVIP